MPGVHQNHERLNLLFRHSGRGLSRQTGLRSVPTMFGNERVCGNIPATSSPHISEARVGGLLALVPVAQPQGWAYFAFVAGKGLRRV